MSNPCCGTLTKMKSVQLSADLPPADSHIMLTYNSLPARPHRAMPRNKTGIYLGSDAPPNSPRTYHSVPPLAKPRGTLFRPRTPTDNKRRRAYTVPGQADLEQGESHLLPQVSVKPVLLTDDPDCLSTSLLYIYNHPCPAPMALPYTPPMILRLPILRPKQQQRVEALRIREEPRGFHPQPVRKAKPKVKQDETQSLPGNTNNDQAPVLRKSARNFVAAANSGVTHLEDLGLEELSLRSVSTGRESSIPPSIIEDIQNTNKRMVGLQECYSKICKGNLSSLQSLLPARKTTGGRTKTIATPLTIRSFRNPRSPHSVVQYSDLRHKSMGIGTSTKPLVPAPYYYSSKGLPNTTDDGGSKVRLTRLPASSRSTERVLAAPGVGAISQSALNRQAASLPSDPPQGIEGIPPPSRSSNTKFMDSEDHYAHKDGFRVPSGTPAVSATDLHKIGSSSSVNEHQNDGQKASLPKDPRHSSEVQPAAPPVSPASTRKLRTHVPVNQNNSHSIPTGLTNGGSISESASDVEDPRPDLCSAKSEGSSRSSTITQGDRVLPSAVAIVVSVQDDSGESHVVDLEEELETEYEGDSKDAVPHGDSEQLIHEWQEASEKKQAEFQRLLEEHQEIVSRIEELEKVKEQGGGDIPQGEVEEEG
ncbi:uncharacterized protein LOC119720636 isoform X2 [Patiria miniata]|uniref:Uncharacterized protein n=1 Tax=Patiria miniata TaxID=46514 RepID=A0A913Z3H8_PATMI|nr:uncharacterized protein LOC119720636 isoform X2 [Patiria miniata]